MSAYRSGLSRVIGGAAIPYGYTVLVWTSGGVLIHTHGPPSPASAFLFLAGAAGGFAAVALAGCTGHEAGAVSGDADPRWISVSSGIAAAIGLAGATAVAAIVAGPLAFGLAAVLATVLYLVASAAGVVLADRRTGPLG